MKLRRDGDCLVLVRPGRDDVVAVPTNDVWDLFAEIFGGEMADGNSTAIGEPKAHRCGGAELRVWRMRLAMLEWDEDAWAQVISELGDCPSCLRNAMANALHLHSNDFARNSGGNSRAADLTLREIAREVMTHG
jgi:hypothetical protein